jgi:hypothetical protein
MSWQSNASAKQKRTFVGGDMPMILDDGILAVFETGVDVTEADPPTWTSLLEETEELLLAGTLIGALTGQRTALRAWSDTLSLGDNRLETETTPIHTAPPDIPVPVCTLVMPVDATAGDDTDIDDLPFFGGGANSTSFHTISKSLAQHNLSLII